jgi:hypothetical protein
VSLPSSCFKISSFTSLARLRLPLKESHSSLKPLGGLVLIDLPRQQSKSKQKHISYQGAFVNPVCSSSPFLSGVLQGDKGKTEGL